MLLPMLFCITFFALPLLGIMVLALQKRNKAVAEEVEEIEAAEAVKKNSEREIKVASFPGCANNRIMHYQLIETHIKMPLRFKKRKGSAPYRAGPEPDVIST